MIGRGAVSLIDVVHPIRKTHHLSGEDPHDDIKAETLLIFLSYFQMAETSLALNSTFGAYLIGIIVSAWFIYPQMHSSLYSNLLVCLACLASPALRPGIILLTIQTV